MTTFQIFTVNYLITVESVQTMGWRISYSFDITGSGFKLSILYVYRERCYCPDNNKQNKIISFRFESHFTITYWLGIGKKNPQIIFIIQINLPLLQRSIVFFFLNTKRYDSNTDSVTVNWLHDTEMFKKFTATQFCQDIPFPF
jgi:hypothetical protein